MGGYGKARRTVKWGVNFPIMSYTTLAIKMWLFVVLKVSWGGKLSQLFLRFTLLVHERIACEQAPKWGIGRRQKSSSERGPPNRAPLARLTEFSFRPKPHLGVCSQAGVRTELSSNIREYSHFKLIGSVVKWPVSTWSDGSWLCSAPKGQPIPFVYVIKNAK